MYRSTTLRREISQIVRYIMGGKCCICGYNKCFSALEAHHVDPLKKEFSLSANGATSRKGLQKIIEESAKCVLLCANCHREYHKGLIETAVLERMLEHDLPLRKTRAETVMKSALKPAPKAYYCSNCGSIVSAKHVKRCVTCYRKSCEVIDWPPTNQLKEMVKNNPFTTVGKMLGVSDNAVRKRLKNHNK